MLEINLKTTLKGHQNQIFALEKGHPNTLFSGGNDKGVVEWDIEEMKFKRILCAVPSPVYALHKLPSHTGLIAIGLRQGEVLIVDYDKQKLIAKLKINKGAVFAIKAIPQKGELVVIGEEGFAYIFDLDTFALLYRFKISDKTVRTIEVDKQGKFIYFGDKDGAIYQFDCLDYRLVNQSLIHQMPVTSLLYRDGKLYTGGRDAKLYKLNAENLGIQQEITPHMFTVYGIVHFYDNALIATASRDKTWKIWDPDTLSLIKNISIDRGYDSHTLSINTVLSYNQHIFTAGDDKVIKVWQALSPSREAIQL